MVGLVTAYPVLSIFFFVFFVYPDYSSSSCTTILFHPSLVVHRADLTGEHANSQDVNLPFHFQSRAVDINYLFGPPQASPSLSRFRRPIITTYDLFFSSYPFSLLILSWLCYPLKTGSLVG